MIGAFWRDSGRAAQIAMLGFALSILFFIVATIGGFFAEPVPQEYAPPPGVEEQSAFGAAMFAGIAFVVQILIVLALRRRESAFRVVAALLAAAGALFVFFVSFFMAGELASGGAPMWLWPTYLLLIATGMAYLVAAVIGFVSRPPSMRSAGA